jgi:hypothetical protein
VPTYFPGQGQPQAPQPRRAGSYFPGSADPGQAQAPGVVPGSAGDYPEVAWADTPHFWDAARRSAAVMFNSDPEDLATAIGKIPGAEIARTAKGEPVARIGGKLYSMNKPGASLQDFLPPAGALAGTLASGGASLPAAGASLGRTMLADAAAGAGLGVAETAGKQLSGVPQGVGDYERSAATGGASSILGGLVARPLGRWLASSGGGLLDDAGALTATGQRALADAKVDPGSLTPDTLKAVDQALRAKAVTPLSTAATVRQETAKRFGIDLTAGQATRAPQQLAAEAMLAKGGRGMPASELMQGRTGDQLGALPVAAENIAQRVAPQASLGSGAGEYGAGQDVIEGLRQAAVGSKAGVNAAYDTFRQAAQAGGHVLPPEAGDRFAAILPRVFDQADTTVLPETAPQAFAVTRDVLGRVQGQGVTPELAEAVRRRISNALEGLSPTDPKFGTEKRALGLVKNAYDGWFRQEMGALPSAEASGVVGLLDHARAQAAQHFATFGPRAAGQPGLAAVVKAVDPRGPQIEPTPLINALFGGSGEVNQAALPVARRVRDALGPTSDAWQQVQRALIRRVALGSEDKQAMGLEAGRDGMDAIHGRLQRALEGKGGEALRELLGHSGHAQLSELRDVVGAMRPAPHFVTGPSGAATTRAVGEGGAKLAGTLAGTAAGAGVGALGHMVGAPWLAAATAPIGGMVGREIGPMLRNRAGAAAAARALAGYTPPPAMDAQIAAMLPPALTAAAVAPPWYPPQRRR